MSAMIPQFAAGQKVLCFHGPSLYGAKCLKLQNTEGSNGQQLIKYLIHYNGWSQKWDEWVEAHRMREINEDNLAFQRQINETQRRKKQELAFKKKEAAAREKSASGTVSAVPLKITSTVGMSVGGSFSAQSSPAPDSVSSSAGVGDGVGATRPSKRRKVEISNVQEETPSGTRIPIATLDLSSASQAQLWRDYSLIHDEKRLVPLPRSKEATVQRILRDFIAHCKRSHARLETLAKLTSNGIESAFNAALGSKLLYHFERVQYAELKESHPDHANSELYGAEHLLRLFVALPDHLKIENITATSEMAEGMGQLMRFLIDQKDKYFTLDYEMAAPDYMRQLAAFAKG